MTDDLVQAKDEHGRDILVYAKGKAPKEKPRYTTRPLRGTEPSEAPAPVTRKPEKE